MKKTAEDTLTDTGERMIPEFHKGTFMYGEHFVRYQSVASLVKDKIVLDIACGSGYGTKKLAETANKVVGVDIDAPTVAYAKKHFHAKNVEYLKGDGVKIPLEDHSVDVVVSFETIEHIVKYETFLDECKRVLKPKGIMILSTPNDKEFSEDNHFHVHEFVHDELEKLVCKNFDYSSTYFQGTWIANGLFKKEQLTSEWSARKPVLNLSAKPTSRAIYFFVVASDAPISGEVNELIALSEHWSRREIEEEHKATHVHVRNLEAIIQKKTEEAVELKQENSKLHSEINRIKGSMSWKVVTKIQHIKAVPKKLLGK